MYLQHLDREAALVGASRGSGDDIESTVMLIGAPAVVASYGDVWVTPFLMLTLRLLAGLCWPALAQRARPMPRNSLKMPDKMKKLSML